MIILLIIDLSPLSIMDCLLALMIYGEPDSSKSVFTEEKYKKMATCFVENGFAVDSVLYHDSQAEQLDSHLSKYDAILVWVNPVEQGHDRKILDSLLKKQSLRGCLVSAHPDTILKMGTKEVLYDVRETGFGTDVRVYRSFEEFREQFFTDITGSRILKPYRGNGGEGVFRVDADHLNANKIIITHAKTGDKQESLAIDEFFSRFKDYFNSNSPLIDQVWNPNIVNGMVRCYLSGKKVAGFGYQEVNALFPIINGIYKKPGQRFYYSQDCGLFSDLKEVMERKWISQLQEITGVADEMLPVIWDADFFIDKINHDTATGKYTLCEINVSSVSPFPESSIPFILDEVKKRIPGKQITNGI